MVVGAGEAGLVWKQLIHPDSLVYPFFRGKCLVDVRVWGKGWITSN